MQASAAGLKKRTKRTKNNDGTPCYKQEGKMLCTQGRRLSTSANDIDEC